MIELEVCGLLIMMAFHTDLVRFLVAPRVGHIHFRLRNEVQLRGFSFPGMLPAVPFCWPLRAGISGHDCLYWAPDGQKNGSTSEGYLGTHTATLLGNWQVHGPL